jgi:hypothetical protein
MKRHSLIGSITRLKRGLEMYELQEKFFKGTAGNEVMHCRDGNKSQQWSIVVTTNVDVECSPRL